MMRRKKDKLSGYEVLKALENRQVKLESGPRAAGLLKKTLEHLKSDAGDMTSAEFAAIVWHK